MLEVSPSPSRPASGRWRVAVAATLRWGLPVLWVLWAGLAWWVEPRESTEAQLDRDLAAGRVVTYQRADGWSDDTAYWGSRPDPRPATQGWMIVWTLPSGQTRYAPVQPTDAQSYPAEPDRSAHAGPDAALAAVADPWGTADAPAHRIADVAALLAVVLPLLWLGRLIGGAPPLAGTRWFWFWVGLLPLGVGVLAWTYRELWRPPSTLVPDRGSGWRGFGWLILAGVGIALLLSVARLLLGTTVVPG